MQYTPSPVNDWQALNDELQRLARSFAEPTDFLSLGMLYAAPSKPRDGMIALADGSSWNPGSGAGYYGYRAGAWRFLG